MDRLTKREITDICWRLGAAERLHSNDNFYQHEPPTMEQALFLMCGDNEENANE